MKNIIQWLCFLTFIFILNSLKANRIDSFKIQKTSIHLSIKNFSQKKISGHTAHQIQFKKASNTIDFDLSGMQIDSICINQNKLTFNRLGDRIKIQLLQNYLANDTVTLSIFYQGTPAKDPSGWGGFYFTGDYAFNLGVGFQVNPHSYGRAWFPCVDEFDMKTAYEFFIETDLNYTAACNGILIDTNTISNSKIWHYQEQIPMSAYLVSVSVSKYSIVQSTFQGQNSTFPIWLMSVSGDTNKVKNSFVNLPKAIELFEKAFGPQIYSKVGYNMVPFNGGAMEHAGNITYPSAMADGSLNNERLMAHELSHHWWGNNVTCKTAEDMWLNEGWASYCEHLFNEAVYGQEAYKKSILDNHLFVLRFAHIRDQNVFSLTNIPHEYTYGSHVYKKGADVIHSLRGVVGDSAFFRACRLYHNNYYLQNASTEDLESVFETFSGNKANAFFENWIKEKGFPHIEINNPKLTGMGPYILKFKTIQKPRFTNKFYKDLPIEMFFFINKNQYEKRILTINNETDSFEFTLNFKPQYICLDFDEKLSDAITDRFLTVGALGITDFPETFSKIITKKITDSAFVRVEHHWVGPELYRTTAPYMSNYRYLSLGGVWHDSTQLDFELQYDGRQGGVNSSAGYLDHGLIFKTEDSLTVLYRAYSGDYWRVWNEIEFQKGNLNDKQGRVIIKNAKKGDYVFAMYDQSLSTPMLLDLDSNMKKWSILPNPASNYLNIIFNFPYYQHQATQITIKDLSGKEVYSGYRNINSNEMMININDLSNGMYIVQMKNGLDIETKRIVINKN